MAQFILLVYAFGAIAFTQLAVSLIPIWFLPSIEPWATADYFSVFATHVFMGVTAVFFWRKILPAQCHKVWPCVFAGCTLFLLAGGFIIFQLVQS